MSGTSKKRARKDEVTTYDDCDAGSWECTVCTYRNRFEAFKCEMCDTRKGTSTRKPRLNENVVQMQKVVQNFVVQQQEKAASSFKRRAHQSVGSPSTSRHSPESSSSGSAVRSLNTHGECADNILNNIRHFHEQLLRVSRKLGEVSVCARFSHLVHRNSTKVTAPLPVGQVFVQNGDELFTILAGFQITAGSFRLFSVPLFTATLT
ncbi:hypothetical protein Q1695_000474 [Nippostrongylus brasiliensis]|nr:hypothetical protein Q1695_000474 [Nippostrongylus brasiliensis]